MKLVRSGVRDVACPCGATGGAPDFIGVTHRANEYGAEAKFAWFSGAGCGHYFFLFVRAPFLSHGHGGEYEFTQTDRWAT